MIWIVLTLASALFAGIHTVFAKKYLDKFNSTELLYSEYLFTFFIMIFCLKYINLNLSYIVFLFLFLKGIFLIGAWTIYLHFLKTENISLIAPMGNLSPIILLFLSSIFLSEKLTVLQIVGILISIISVYFLEIINHNKEKKNPYKHHFNHIMKKKKEFLTLIGVMLLLSSLSAILDKKIFQYTNLSTNLFYTALMIIIMMTIFIFYNKHLKIELKKIACSPILIIISFLIIISNLLVLYVIAMPAVMISLIIPIKRTSTIFASLFGGVLFHESHMVKKFFIISLLLAGVFLISM